MIVLLLFRAVYFGMAFLGLLIVYAEWLHARWVYIDLVDEGINGGRQELADHFKREEALRIVIQLIMLAIAVGGFVLAKVGGVKVERVAIPWVIGLQCLHMAVVWLLAYKAWMNRHKRIMIMNSADAAHVDVVRRSKS